MFVGGNLNHPPPSLKKGNDMWVTTLFSDTGYQPSSAKGNFQKLGRNSDILQWCLVIGGNFDLKIYLRKVY